jgi:hypothetical protein
MSREFENAMCGYAARSILNADRPLARHEIFPKEGIFAGSLSKSWQNRILEWFVKDGHVTERKRNGVLLYEARNKAALADTARACPPIEEEEEEAPMRTAGYNKQEWDKWARVTVALRALKRLLASHQSDGDSAKWQPRTTLFIAKKGDKFQQRAVMDPSWQKAFLNECVDNGVLKIKDEVGIPLYGIKSFARVTGIIEQNSELCVHTLLWPDTPCTIDHTRLQNDEEEEESEEETEESEEEAGEDEDDKPDEDKVEEKIPEAAAQPQFPAQVPTVEPHKPETDEESNDKMGESNEALAAILDLVTSVADNQSAVTRTIEANNQLQRRLLGELEHLHSKLDKIHDENVHLRKEHEEMGETLESMQEQLSKVAKAISPEESSINAIRKRLGELEKLSKDHADALHSSNQLMKGSLAEAATAMVNAAAKAFIQTDHSAVLIKMETVEGHLVEEQSRTQQVLREVFEALERVRAEYRSNTRTPAILDRMNAIAEELQRLQGLLPGLSTDNSGLNLVSDKLARAQGRP